jgi:hypothetical protein
MEPNSVMNTRLCEDHLAFSEYIKSFDVDIRDESSDPSLPESLLPEFVVSDPSLITINFVSHCTMSILK